MTYSIVAHDPASGSWGVAVASKFLAVGAVVPWGRAGVGALATQALANLAYGPSGLGHLETGADAAQVTRRLTSVDPGRAHRQLGVVDGGGQAATFTGDECLEWAGGRTAEGVAVQGNILAGPEVVDSVLEAYQGGAGAFEDRLVAALTAGDRAGGDRRGRQSAALRVWRAGGAYGGILDMAVDLRVDDHTDPVTELGRLLGLQRLYFGRPDPDSLLPLEGELAGEVGAALAKLGHDPAASGGLEPALAAWAGVENLEERLVPGKLDPVVLGELRARAGQG